MRTRQTQNRRVISTSSGFVSSPEAVIGSSAMPQMGQLPGPSRTISGCIGQVYCLPASGSAGASRPFLDEETLRLGAELLQASLAAEVIGRAAVLVRARGRLGVDVHPADRILAEPSDSVRARSRSASVISQGVHVSPRFPLKLPARTLRSRSDSSCPRTREFPPPS